MKLSSRVSRGNLGTSSEVLRAIVSMTRRLLFLGLRSISFRPIDLLSSPMGCHALNLPKFISMIISGADTMTVAGCFNIFNILLFFIYFKILHYIHMA